VPRGGQEVGELDDKERGDIMTTSQRLGVRQRGVLEGLVQFGGWHSEGMRGWSWGSPSETETILLSLKRRGLAALKVDQDGGRWVITDAGREEVLEKKPTKRSN